MANHEFTTDPSGGIVISSGYTLGQLAGGVHYEAVSTNISGAVSTLDFGGKAVLLHTVTGDLSGSYTFPPINIPSLTQNSTRSILFIEYTQDGTGNRAIPLDTLFANATRRIGLAGSDSVDLAAGGRTRVRLTLKRIGGVVESDVEFIPVHRHANLSVATQHSLTGGGTLAASRTLNLVGDTASPGNRKFYGTDGAGARGWKGLNIDDLDDVTITAPTSNQVLTYNGSIFVNAEPPAGGGGVASEVVDTIAALQAIAVPTSGQIVHVRGYTTAFDGGAGTFMWDPSATDYKMLSVVTVNAGGTGYAVGQLLWIVGGTAPSTSQACVRVATLSGSAVATVTIVFEGMYSVATGTTGIATTNKPTVGGGVLASPPGTGCTLDLTWVSHTNYGTTFPNGSGGTGRWERLVDDTGRVSIRAFGAKGGGVDDWIPIYRAVNSGEPLSVPSGSFKVSKALTWRGTRNLSITGAGKSMWASSLIELTQDTDEPLLHKFGRYMTQDGSYQFETGYEVSGSNLGGVEEKLHLQDLCLYSRGGDYGSCCELTLSNKSFFLNVSFLGGFRGLTLGQAVFDTTIINCDFNNDFMSQFLWAGTTGAEANKTIAKRAWGLNLTGHAFVYGCVFVGNGTGIRMTGTGNVFSGSRMEVNNYGIILAASSYSMGQVDTTTISRSSIDGISMEANTIAITVENATSTSITNFGIQGSVASSPRPISEIGVLINSMDSLVTISNGTCAGTFTHGGIVNNSRLSVQNFSSSGNIVSYAKANSVFGNTGTTQPSFKLIGHNNGESTITAFSDFMMKGITGLNIRDGYARSRNLGDVVTPATGATTVAVLFPVSAGASTYAFNAMTQSANGASTLSTGTYYYGTTVISKQSETGINYSTLGQHAYKSIAVTAGNQVNLTFFGGTVSWLKRRIYRSKVDADPGNFEGYWEQSNTGSGFTDTGTLAFTGRGMPPASNNIIACDEQDTNYQIMLQPSWGTTCWVTAKATTGFTINFGTATPAGGTCAWLLFRP